MKNIREVLCVYDTFLNKLGDNVLVHKEDYEWFLRHIGINNYLISESYNTHSINILVDFSEDLFIPQLELIQGLLWYIKPAHIHINMKLGETKCQF